MRKDYLKMDSSQKIDYLMTQFESMRTDRSYFEEIWIDVDKLVQGVDYSYDSKPIERRKFVDVYDGSIMHLVRRAASAYVGLIWKKFGNSIKVRLDDVEENTENKDWVDMVNKQFAALLDDPEVNFDGVLAKAVTEGILKGPMSPAVYLDDEGDIFFKSHAARFLYFKDNARDIIDFIAIRSWKPVHQVVEEYGIENVGKAIAERYHNKSQINGDVEVIQFIMKNPDKKLAQEKPYVQVDIARTEKHILTEMFRDYFPIKVGRFYESEWSQYPTSPCMDSIMLIKRNNAITGEVYETAELNNKPVMSLFVDQVAGDGNISGAPGSINQFNSNTSGQRPLDVLWSGGNPAQAWAIVQDLKQTISEALNLDVLLDFNNTVQMTATEVNVRDSIRASALNMPLSSMITRMLNPLLNETFSIMLNKGDFGLIEGSDAYLAAQVQAELEGVEFTPELIPADIVDAINQGKSVYKIDYLTPAARLLQSQEINTAFSMLEFVAGTENIFPGSKDNVDPNKYLRNTLSNAGMNEELRSTEEVEQIEKAKAELAEQERAKKDAQTNANIENTEAQTDSMMRG